MDTPELTRLRATLKLARAGLNHTTRQAFDKTICEYLSTWLRAKYSLSETIHLSGFWPIHDEPDLRPLFTSLRDHHQISILLPVVVKKHAPLIFKEWDSTQPMVVGNFGILEPCGREATPNIILTPLLGFTAQGDRIGYGGGFYDRTIAQLRQNNPQLLTIGIAYGCGLITDKNYRPQAHDEQLDALLTEQGWVKSPTIN